MTLETTLPPGQATATLGAHSLLQSFFDPSVVLTYIAVLAGQGGLGGCGCIDNGGGGEGRLGAAAAAGAGGRGRERPLKHLLGCAALP